MKKAFLIALTLVISFAFVTAVFAQATTEPRKDTAPSTAPTGKAPEKAAPKAKTMTYVGDVTKVDAMAKTIMVKGTKGEMTFDVSMANWKPYKSMDEVKQGDPVTVKYMEKEGKMMASSVTKAPEKKKSEKKEMQMEKPAAKPMEPAPAKK